MSKEIDEQRIFETEKEIHQYLEEVFSSERHVKTIDVHFNKENNLFNVTICGEKVGRIIGSRGWILKLLIDVIKLKFNQPVRFSVKEVK